MRVLVSYRGIPDKPGWEMGASLARGFRQLGHEVYPYGNVYQSQMRIGNIPEGGVDLLVWVECNDADPQYLELAKLDCPKIMYDQDTAMHLQQTADLAGHLKPKVLFLGNRECKIEVSGVSVQHMPWGADTTLFRPGTGPRTGAAMMGTPFKDRVEFCNRAGILLMQRYCEEYAKTLQELQVHVHHTTTAGDELIVTRNWETLAAGCCLLTKDTKQIREYFTPGVHLLAFKDDADCVRQVKWAKDHPGEVAKISEAGYREVMARHTYRHRVEAILEAL